MTVLWIILGSLLGIILLALSLVFFGRARVRITYNGKIKVILTVCKISFTVIGKEERPRKEKSLSQCKNPERALKKELKRQKRAAKKALKKALKKKQKAAQKALEKQRRKAASPSLGITEHIAIIGELLKVVRDGTKGHLKLRIRALQIRIATEDAAKTAILYGAVLQAASLLLEWIDSAFPIVNRKHDVLSISPDYLSAKTYARIDIECSMSIFRLLGLVISLLTTHSDAKQRAVLRARKKPANKH